MVVFVVFFDLVLCSLCCMFLSLPSLNVISFINSHTLLLSRDVHEYLKNSRR